MAMEEFEPFHWYINGHSAKTFLVTFTFFISILLLIFLFLRFIRKHVSPEFYSVQHNINNSNIRRQETYNNDVIEYYSGVDVEVIKKLPIFMHRTTSFPEMECCICLGVYEDKEMVKVMPECLHAFHSHCIDRWLTTQSTCPLCRSDLLLTSQ